jgi:hypothetical protein
MYVCVYMYVKGQLVHKGCGTAALNYVYVYLCSTCTYIHTHTYIKLTNYQQTCHVLEDLNLWRCCIWIFLRTFWKECLSHTKSKQFGFEPLNIFTSLPLPISVGNVLCSKCTRIGHLRNTKYENECNLC